MSCLEDLLTGTMLVLREGILYLSIPPNKKIKRMELLPLHLSNCKQPPPQLSQKLLIQNLHQKKHLRPVSPKSKSQHKTPKRSNPATVTVGSSCGHFCSSKKPCGTLSFQGPSLGGIHPGRFNGGFTYKSPHLKERKRIWTKPPWGHVLC